MIRSLMLEAAVLVVGWTAFVSSARGERVGYQFQGALIGGSGSTTLFGISVPRNSPITGTFSYDTTTAGVDVAAGEKTYHQYIDGGYTLDINHGGTNEIKLSASDYVITVDDDFESTAPPGTFDVFDVEFNSNFNPAPPPILVNGNPYTATPADLKFDLSWPPSAFAGPELTADGPGTPDSTASNFVGGPSPKLFSMSSISRIPSIDGDYNLDGAFSSSDYVEWRKVFGSMVPDDLYADGNHNGVVDAADYVVWREASNSSHISVPVPEPMTAYLAVIALSPLMVCRRVRAVAP